MNSLKKKYITASVLQFICIILWFIPLCTMVKSYTENFLGEIVDVTTENCSMIDFLNGEEAWLICSIIGLIFSLFLLILPVVKSTENKKRRLIYSKISVIYSLVMMLTSYYFPYSRLTEYLDIGDYFKFGFGGIIFIIFNVTLFVILIKISLESKKANMYLEENQDKAINE